MTLRTTLRHWRLHTGVLASLLAVACLFEPAVTLPQPVFRFQFVVDITQSMNARDYQLEGMPADRLSFAKQALRKVLLTLPCGSEIGVGLFTTQHSQMLFEPIELCGHLTVIDTVIDHIDWRMAWAADSDIDHGLYAAIREASRFEKPTRVVFLSDGQQFPPNAEIPPFQGPTVPITGLIVGVGGPQAVPIPRYDRDNRFLGNWQYSDVESFLPREESAEHPRRDRHDFPGFLDEARLRKLSAMTGLGYHRLQSPDALAAALMDPAFAEQRPVRFDLRPPFAIAALVLIALGFVIEWRKSVRLFFPSPAARR